jgi:hypothetical protein
MKITGSTALGAVAGLAIAAADVAAIWLNQGRSPLLENITNFFGALPVLLFWWSDVPEVVSIALFFIYWAVAGTVLAWLIGHKGRVPKIAALILLVALGLSHRAAQLKLEKQMEDAIRAAGGHGFSQEPKQR